MIKRVGKVSSPEVPLMQLDLRKASKEVREFTADVKILVDHLDSRELPATNPKLFTLLTNVKRHLRGRRKK